MNSNQFLADGQTQPRIFFRLSGGEISVKYFACNFIRDTCTIVLDPYLYKPRNPSVFGFPMRMPSS